MSQRTVISLRGTMEHDLVRLGRRASTDPKGVELLHDVRNILLRIEGAEASMPPLDAFQAIVDETARVHERVTDYVTGRDRARVDDAPTSSPTSDVVEQIREAIEGPNAGPAADTMQACPSCKGCGLCGDRRFVPVREAIEWRARHGKADA